MEHEICCAWSYVMLCFPLSPKALMPWFIIQITIFIWFCVDYSKQQLKCIEMEGESSQYINQKWGTHKNCHYFQQKFEDQKKIFLWMTMRARELNLNLYYRAANRAPVSAFENVFALKEKEVSRLDYRTSCNRYSGLKSVLQLSVRKYIIKKLTNTS